MKSPLKNTFESFCELVVAEVTARGFVTQFQVTKFLSMSSTTWNIIVNKKSQNMESANNYKLAAWIKILTRICDKLELDLDACLAACGLPKNEHFIGRAHQQMQDDVNGKELSEKDLSMLLELVKKAGKPIPLRFAFEYLALMKKEE